MIFVFPTNVQNICFSCLIPKMILFWGSQESQEPPVYQVRKSLKWIIWDGMTGRGLTGLHFLPQGETLTADYYINNTLEKDAKPLLRRKNVNEAIDKLKLFSSNRHMASARSQGKRKNKLASKFARYKPCGESLDHNG